MRTAHSIAASVAAITALLMVNAMDPLLTAASGAVLILAIALLWRTDEIPILLLPFGLQWVAVVTKPIQAALLAAPLDGLSERGASLTPAAWLALGALTLLALGMRIGVGPAASRNGVKLTREVVALPQSLVVSASLAAIAGGHAIDLVAYSLGPAVQAALALSNIRLAGIFALTLWCLLTGRQTGLLAAVMVFEIIFGMTGFFGEFKGALLVFLIAAVASSPRVQPINVILGVAALLLLIVAAVFWSAIKPDYRAFLNDGTGEQVVVQPIADRIAYLNSAAQHFDQPDFERGVEALVARQSYIDFLAQTIAYVPAYRAHEGGERTIEAVQHVLMPRLLFPEKPPVPHDTDVTARYTGLSFNLARTTSISIGWLGELYIDFSWTGALLGAFILGCVIGWIARLLLNYGATPLTANYAIGVTAMLPFTIFEIPLIKLAGGALTSLVVLMAVQRLVVPHVLSLLGFRALIKPRTQAT